MKSSTLNESRYAELLCKLLPRVIHNDRELEHFTEALLELENIDHPTAEENELAELLINLIESYETENYSLNKAAPSEVIQFLMDQRGLAPKDLAAVVGSKGTASDVINGRRNIGVVLAVKLGHFFNIAPEIFIQWEKHAAAGG